jgi:lysozyme family protein
MDPQMTFEECVEIILKHEGGYTNNPNDPGLETKYGISKKSYPNEDIKTLTYLQAKEIYRRDFWEKLGVHNLPETHRLMYFDCAVNQGPGRAKALYDQAKVLKDDHFVLEAFAKARMNHYASLPGWKTFGAGWAKRLLDVTLVSLF